MNVCPAKKKKKERKTKDLHGYQNLSFHPQSMTVILIRLGKYSMTLKVGKKAFKNEGIMLVSKTPSFGYSLRQHRMYPLLSRMH